jgi:hypothetical protein
MVISWYLDIIAGFSTVPFLYYNQFPQSAVRIDVGRHAIMQMTQRYAHLSPDVYAEEWGRLEDVVPREAEVLPFAGSAKEEEG